MTDNVVDFGRLLRLSEVSTLTSLSRTTIYRWIGTGIFPAPIRVGPNCSRWRSIDVEAWLRGFESDKKAG